MDFQELLLEKKKLNSDIRILDFNLISGSASAKLLKFGEKSVDVKISFETFSNAQTQNLAQKIADNCYFIAALLAETRTEELRELLTASISKTSFNATVDGKKVENTDEKVITTMSKVAESFEESFWNFFLAFGVGKEELSTEIFRARKKYKNEDNDTDRSEEKTISPEQVERFWELNKESLSNKYDIRADELPASTLRRLDPLPLSGLEEDADPFFVETYERVSRLAQSYGLSLVSD